MAQPSENETVTPHEGAMPLAGEEVICGLREATLDDIPALVDMAEKFIGAAWAHVNVPFDRETCECLLAGLIDSPMGLVLVTEGGMMGAVVYPWHFNANVLTGQELFWWSESRGGMAMVEVTEQWARSMGAETFNMACLDHMRGKAIGRMYERYGYVPNEHAYIKVLN